MYIGYNNGDYFVSLIIIEANEAPGTPTIKVGAQTFENGLWFREVTAKANGYKMEGSDEEIPTILTYTTDGTDPSATSPEYSEPIKCYAHDHAEVPGISLWDLVLTKASSATVLTTRAM